MKARSLYLLLKILHADGISANARVAHGNLYVSIDGPSDTELPWTRIFATSETRRAADWLSNCAVSLYPMSALAKVRRLVAEAIAALPR